MAARDVFLQSKFERNEPYALDKKQSGVKGRACNQSFRDIL